MNIFNIIIRSARTKVLAGAVETLNIKVTMITDLFVAKSEIPF